MLFSLRYSSWECSRAAGPLAVTHGGHLHPRLPLPLQNLCLASDPWAALDGPALGPLKGSKGPFLSVLESPPVPNPLHLALLAPTPKASPDLSPTDLMHTPFLALNTHSPTPRLSTRTLSEAAAGSFAHFPNPPGQLHLSLPCVQVTTVATRLCPLPACTLVTSAGVSPPLTRLVQGQPVVFLISARRPTGQADPAIRLSPRTTSW